MALYAGDFVPTEVANAPTAPADSTAGTRIAKSESLYLPDGKLGQWIDAAGRAVTIEYDSFGRRKKSSLPTVPGQPRDTFEQVFDDFGRPLRVIATSHQENLTNPLVKLVDTSYDRWSRIVRTTAAPGSEDLITTFEYDGLSRRVRTVGRWEIASTYSGYHQFDRIGETEYDLAGRTVATRQRRSSDDVWIGTKYSFSRDGLLTRVEDAEGNQSDWAYKSGGLGGLGRLQKMQYPAASGIRQTVVIGEYDKNGKSLTVRQQADDSPSVPMVIWSQSYDNQGRLVTRSGSHAGTPAGTVFYGTQSQSFGYDDLGRIAKATDSSPDFSASAAQDIVVEKFYDTGGRLIKEAQSLPLNGAVETHAVESTYLPDGFRATLTYPKS